MQLASVWTASRAQVMEQEPGMLKELRPQGWQAPV